MAESLVSPHWYRVAGLRPRLPPQARLHRHDYRGTNWYVLEDTASGHNYRFNGAVEPLIAKMDGAHTVAQIWEHAKAELGDVAPTQAQVIWLLGRLHAADLLVCDVPPDTAELLRHQQRTERQHWRSRFINPLALRFPLFDPDRFLERASPWARPLFTRAALWVWLATLAAAVLLAAKHWPGLAAHAAEKALTPGNLLLLLLLYLPVKALHELGHGLATKVWGGAVHEMGIMLLVLAPVPYVEASAASAFPERRQRIVVAAAGIVVELFIAAVALFVWMHVQPGPVRDVAFNLMLIGGVSTVLFNGNPLLRFDGYYVLADAAGIPGLGPRAARYYAYLAQRYLFGLRAADSPVSAPGERGWFIGYGLASFVYRLFVIAVIVLYLITKYFAIGVVLAVWALAVQIVSPLVKGVRFVLTSPQLQDTRRRAILTAFGGASVLLAALFVVPVPLATHADGVVWLPEQAQVRAGADGFVQELLAPDGSHVQPGDALVRLSDPDLALQLQALEAANREIEIRYYAARTQDRVVAQGMYQELRAARATLARLRQRATAQIVRAAAAGVLVIPEASKLPGRFVKQGEVIGFVVDWSALTARVVVPQADIGLIRRATRSVQLRSADLPAVQVAARLQQEIGGAVDRLPSAALGSLGGGRIEVDPLDEAGTRATEQFFQLDLRLPRDVPWARIGTRVYARFHHGYEPLAYRWWRALRRQ